MFDEYAEIELREILTDIIKWFLQGVADVLVILGLFAACFGLAFVLFAIGVYIEYSS